MTNLFANKYYQQLFEGSKMVGGRRQKKKQQQQNGGDDASENTEARLSRIFGGDDSNSGNSSLEKLNQTLNGGADEFSETTNDRLKRIFGGGNGNSVEGTNIAKQLNAIFSAGEGVVPAPNTNTMTGGKRRVSEKLAQQQFDKYFDTKLKNAKAYNNAHNLTGRKSRAVAVRRSKTIREKYAHKNSKRMLNNKSKRGYLFLRESKEHGGKFNKSGVMQYNFRGVAPKLSKGYKISKKGSKHARGSKAAKNFMVSIRRSKKSKKSRSRSRSRSASKSPSPRRSRSRSASKSPSPRRSRSRSASKSPAKSRSRSRSAATPNSPGMPSLRQSVPRSRSRSRSRSRREPTPVQPRRSKRTRKAPNKYTPTSLPSSKKPSPRRSKRTKKAPNKYTP